MQIIRSGKLPQLQSLAEIYRETFAVVPFMQYLIE